MTEGFTWQALNALAHFFKYVLGVKEPVFDVKLRDTGTRIPVVLAKTETHQLFDEIRKQEEKAKPVKEKDQEKSHGRYELAARLQYGAGLRLSELVRLRVQDPASLHYAGTSSIKSDVLRSFAPSGFSNIVQKLRLWIHHGMRWLSQSARECDSPCPGLPLDCAV